MNINLWLCESMNKWRWTITDTRRSIVKQESGQQEDLKSAMQDVAKVVQHLLDN
jgi:hypothetical protein